PGPPGVGRPPAPALEATLVLADRGGSVLAVAARSPADEASLQDGAARVTPLRLRVAAPPRGQPPPPPAAPPAARPAPRRRPARCGCPRTPPAATRRPPCCAWSPR